MKLKLPKYVTRDNGQGADGRERFYYRRTGLPKVRLHGVPYSTQFMDEYNAAHSGTPIKQGIMPTKDGTFKWLCDQYFESGEYKGLDAIETKPRRFNNLGNICREPIKSNSKIQFGTVPVTSWNKKAVRVIRDRYADMPSRANSYLKTLKALFAWASEIEEYHIETDPAKDVKLLPPKNSRGHHSWTVEEVEQFEATFPIGMKEHLALGLLLYTSQRDSDVIRFGKSTIKLRNVFDDEGNQVFDEETGEPVKRKWIVFTQHKNRNIAPIDLEIPLRPELEEILAAGAGEDPFLLNGKGKPFTVIRFCEWFGKACIKAGVPGRAHGLRKASAARLAEKGATGKEIMAITGHTTMQEVERYTKAANQKRLASAATEKMKPKKKAVG